MNTSPETRPEPSAVDDGPDLQVRLARLIGRLQREYAHGGRPSSWSAATMAALRSATPGDVDTTPASWEALYSAVPDELMGRDDAVSREERAAHATLVLYAVHQTSQSQPMHRPGVRLGQALRRLPGSDDEKSPILPRFTSLTSSSTFEAMAYHLRSLITLLRREGIGLDYVRLCTDLVAFQRPASSAAVRRQWGRDYFGGRGLPAAAEAGPSETSGSTTQTTD